MSTATQQDHWLAWGRWNTRVPADWRALAIDDRQGRGTLMLGNSEHAIARIRWSSPGTRKTSAKTWIEDRVRRITRRAATAPDTQEIEGDASIEARAWLPEVRDEDGVVSDIYYACSTRNDLALEVVVNGAVPADIRAHMHGRVLPAMQLSAPDRPVDWSVFGCGFVSPAGWVLRSKRLNLGDMMLEFGRGHETLRQRQVYPANEALRQHKPQRWLMPPAKRQSRVFLRGSQSGTWTLAENGRNLEGYRRQGVARLRWPLGPIAPRHEQGGVVCDPTLDRLLIAEHYAPHGNDGDLMRETLLNMNRLQRPEAV